MREQPIFKICSCGQTHLVIPSDAKFHHDPDEPDLSGYFWNCQCKSTLFIPAWLLESPKRGAA